MGIVETPEPAPETKAPEAAPEAPAAPAAPAEGEAAPAADGEAKAEPESSNGPQSGPVNQVAQDVATDVASVESSLQTRIKNWLDDVYNSNKFLFYTVIPLVGLIYLVIKYHNLLISLLIKNSKSVLTDQQAADAQAAQQAAATTAAADALVQQADNLPSQQPPVDEDWYNKK
jgi:hypothetical protein